MGEPMDRIVRLNPQRGRLVWAAVAAVAVTIVALAMMVAGVADGVEVVATLLVAPVCVAALLKGRTAGLIAAVVATVAYAVLRQGDMDDAGAIGVALLVTSRAAVYLLVAYCTPLLADRLPALERSAGLRAARRAAEPVFVPGPPPGPPPSPGSASPPEGHGGSLRARDPYLQGWAEAAGGGPTGEADDGDPYDVGDDLMDDEPLPVRRVWEEPLDPALMTPPAGVPGLDEVPWDHPTGPELVTGNGGDHGHHEVAGLAGLAEYDDDDVPAGGVEPGQPAMPLPGPSGAPGGWKEPRRPVNAGFTSGPPAPSVPTGWIDDATAPLGDESIPVGFTGELFLPRELGDIPLDDGMPEPPAPPPSVRIGNGADQHRPGPGGLHPDDGAPRWEEPPPRRGQLVPEPVDHGGGYEPDDAPPPGGQPPVRQAPVGYRDHQPGAAPGHLREPSPPLDPVAYAGSDRLPGAPGAGGWPGAGERSSNPPPTGGRGGPVVTPVPGGWSGLETTGEHEPVSEGMDPETRLWNARFFRDRLTAERDRARREGIGFSVVMVQVPDAPFQPLPYRRQVALLRELGHQFTQARLVDHLVHLPDGAQHWFAVVLGGADRTGAHMVERRLRSAIGGYLRSRGLQVGEIQSASLTSPDDDEAMSAVWASLLGSSPSTT